jgi:hypothetical protein
MAITNYAESWTNTYSKYLGVINFVAGDYETLKSAIRQYVVQQNPEGYNDWAESSEVGMFVNSMAYLGETLHYRIDLNVHDLFPSTTNRKQSLLNFAKMLSYAPNRNICATGIAKVVSVSTTQDITDSMGNNLKNIIVRWSDNSNENWQEQFLTIMNNAFTKNNSFGKPARTDTVDGITTQLYKFNNLINQQSAYPFNTDINGSMIPFEVINPTFDLNSGSIYEKAPIPEESFNILFRNDGSGNTSKNTGFFVVWKQGVLKSKTYSFSQKQENLSIDVDDADVNNTDVWFEQINSSTGYVENIWTKIKPNEYLSYNSTNPNIKTIYKVETKENDKITIRFGDGYFSDIPYGNYRLWYRVSGGNKNLYLKPSDISNISISIPYYNNRVATDTNIYYLTITFSVSDVSHIRQSIQTESLEAIRDAMPAVYATQDRMVTARDYNTYPKVIGEELQVLKSMVRTYSGNSRFVKMNDPTGTYSPVNVLATDGYLYGMNTISKSNMVANDIDAELLVKTYILPKLASYEVQNLYYENYKGYYVPEPVNGVFEKQFVWVTDFIEGDNKINGHFVDEQGKIINYDLFIDTVDGKMNSIAIGDFLCFTDVPMIDEVSEPSTIYAKVLDIKLSETDLSGYQITVSEVLDTKKKWYLRTGKSGYSNYHTLQPYFTQEFIDDVVGMMTEIKDSFGITYNAETREWMIISEEMDSPQVLLDAYRNHTSEPKMVNLGQTNSEFDNYVLDCIFDIQYVDNTWQFNSRLRKYVFGSESETAFFFNTKEKDGNNGFISGDVIKIINGDESYALKPYNTIRYTDGYTDPYKFYVRTFDGDNDDVIDNPIIFFNLNKEKMNKIIFLKTDDTISESSYLKYVNLDVDGVFGSLYEHTLETGYFYTKYKINRVFPAGHILSESDFPEGTDKDDMIVWLPTNEPGQTTQLSNGKITHFKGEKILLDKELEYDVVDFVAGYRQGQMQFFGDAGYLYYYDGYTKSLTLLEEGKDYTLEVGLTNQTFIWKHEPTTNYIIDPCSTNIIDMFVLSTDYYNSVQNWLNSGKVGQFPKSPSAYELSTLFSSLKSSKMISDNMVWHPVTYKLLFGDTANREDRAIFKVVKKSNLVSDNEIKKYVVDLIDTYFRYMNVGETFYFTQLATYIHRNLSNIIDTVLIVPSDSDETFGQLFQVGCSENEILLSTATMDNIQIISNITSQNIRMME